MVMFTHDKIFQAEKKTGSTDVSMVFSSDVLCLCVCVHTDSCVCAVFSEEPFNDTSHNDTDPYSGESLTVNSVTAVN